MMEPRVLHMYCESEHLTWVVQLRRLKESMNNLARTGPKNVLEHFFSQAVEKEFSKELDSVKTFVKSIIKSAITNYETTSGSTRHRAAIILHDMVKTRVLPYIRLSDIRNRAVFDIYKQCGITVDTYFNRYSSPPGTSEQNEIYSKIAHGTACATAEQTQLLSLILSAMQILKRFFLVVDFIKNDTTALTSSNLNWHGAMMSCHIQNHSLSDLIWELFLDIWEYENINL